MEISKELKEQAKACKTAEELVALAKANDIELSTEEADLLLQDFAEGELADNELENVAGGTDGCAKPANPYEMKYWDTEGEVQFIFNVGDILQSFCMFEKHHTATCKVTDRKPHLELNNYWVDLYFLEKVEGSRTPYLDGWKRRDQIEK